MKKYLCVCATGIAMLAVAGCGSKAQKVTAVVAGKDAPVAVVVEYNAPVAAASVTPEAFVVPGKEVAAVFVTDKNPFEKPEGPKPEGECCPEGKDGKYVVVVLKGEEPEGPHHGGPKPEECVPGEGPKDCCKEAPACDKPEQAQCDSCKNAPKPEGPKPEGMEPGKEPHHHGGPKPEGKPKEVKELPVPEIAVQQVADIKTADGKTLKAWKKAVNATAAVPAQMGRLGRHHGMPGAPKPGDKPECEGQCAEQTE